MRWSLAVVIDVVAVMIFAAIGRQAHAEVDDILGVAQTAWPFLVGTAVGTFLGAGLDGVFGRVAGGRVVGRVDGAARGKDRRGPLGLRTGAIVWLSTVVIGMILRVVTGAGVQFSFVVVALIVLGVFLLGWRLLARAIRATVARRRRAGPAGPDRADPPLPRGDGTPRAVTRTPR